MDSKLKMIVAIIFVAIVLAGGVLAISEHWKKEKVYASAMNWFSEFRSKPYYVIYCDTTSQPTGVVLDGQIRGIIWENNAGYVVNNTAFIPTEFWMVPTSEMPETESQTIIPIELPERMPLGSDIIRVGR
jgi:hypothetical protein